MDGYTLPTGRPVIMGVLNVTPDSFSDGGLYVNQEAAFARAMEMIQEGADIIDVGGESTRPGAEPVLADEERRRVVPVIARLADKDVAVSIDTSKAVVAQACLDVGATIVNDVTALGDPAMAQTCSKADCSVCLMHMQGEPRTMQVSPTYSDVVLDVKEALVERAKFAQSKGIAKDRIWIDPGIGFGKTLEHNLSLLRNLDTFAETGYPVMIGVSRKSFLGKVLNGAPVEERIEGAIAAQVLALAKGARIFRTHDVKNTVRALCVAQAILG